MAQTRTTALVALCVLVLPAIALSAAPGSKNSAGFTYKCDPPSSSDPIVYYSDLFGRPNVSDSIWNDQTWAFKQYGPITNMTIYKAYWYDGEWHDPGEFKGIQPAYGWVSNDLELLFGAKKPHLPLSYTLRPGEYFNRIALEWDHIMRYMSLTTNLGGVFQWGFQNSPNTSAGVAEPDRPNLYLAAIRGNEGRPLEPWRGGYRKRYIIQIQFVWAQLQNCVKVKAEAAQSTIAASASTTAAASVPEVGPRSFPFNAWSLGRRLLGGRWL